MQTALIAALTAGAGFVAATVLGMQVPGAQRRLESAPSLMRVLIYVATLGSVLATLFIVLSVVVLGSLVWTATTLVWALAAVELMFLANARRVAVVERSRDRLWAAVDRADLARDTAALRRPTRILLSMQRALARLATGRR